MKKLRTLFPIFFVSIAVIIVAAPVAIAYVASSTNYRIQSDSINIGGILSTSSSYRAEDTIGESGVGVSSSTVYQIKAGYQQMQETYLAVSVPANVTLAPNILPSGGGVANGSATWTVITDNVAGYTMSIQAAGTPALQSGVNNFPNYTPAGVNPDFAFTTPAASARFGFSPEGVDIVQKYKDNGAVCNAGAFDTASACWNALTATQETIVQRASANQPSGTQTTIRFRAESGALNTQATGTYTATTTVTVMAL